MNIGYWVSGHITDFKTVIPAFFAYYNYLELCYKLAYPYSVTMSVQINLAF